MRLEIKDLRVAYGKIEAIKGVSIVVEQGEIVSLIGANGSFVTLRGPFSDVPMKSATPLSDPKQNLAALMASRSVGHIRPRVAASDHLAGIVRLWPALS